MDLEILKALLTTVENATMLAGSIVIIYILAWLTGGLVIAIAVYKGVVNIGRIIAGAVTKVKKLAYQTARLPPPPQRFQMGKHFIDNDTAQEMIELFDELKFSVFSDGTKSKSNYIHASDVRRLKGLIRKNNEEKLAKT